MSDETTLADLLSLNLHNFEVLTCLSIYVFIFNFEDEVHNIVDKACKEMGMEKLLHDLQNVWKELNFDYEEHATGNVMISYVWQNMQLRLQTDEDQ